jgi:hypothetical protein
MVLVTQDVPSLPASPSQLSQPKPQLPQQEPQLRPAAPETAVSVLKTQIPKSAFWGGKILKSANALYSKKKVKNTDFSEFCFTCCFLARNRSGRSFSRRRLGATKQKSH